MPLPAGTIIGVYEVLEAIGAGAMGEVYRARDRRLQRSVAIKILPPAFAHDPDRLARFRREAQLLAALNHPNIAAIYGFEDSPAVCALALELVEGETLAARIASGRLAPAVALPIARQIADALDAAHERGIVHRDLKPANIKVRADGTVKVLDFGLAKALEPAAGGLEDEALMTATGTTSPGVILGTVAYMSPEQARGAAVDKRSDIWAFGCVLYEMLTGAPPFSGETTTDVLGLIMQREPDWSRLPPVTPAAVVRLLQRCLDKDQKRRLRDIGDARVDIDDAQVSAAGAVERSQAAAAPRPRSRERFVWAALVLTLAAAAGILLMTSRRPPPPQEVRFETAVPPSVSSNFTQLALSPDSKQLVVAPTFEGRAQLWLRPVDSVTGRSLAGTDGGYLPFWSPDGRSIGFFADKKLKRISLDSETVEEICSVGLGRGGAWLPDDTILFAPNVSGPLFRVAAAGGPSTSVTKLQEGQTDHRSPVLLPGGTHFLYYARGTPQVRGVYVARLDGSEARRLLEADAPAVYSASGHILFVRLGDLYAQLFHRERLELHQTAYRVAGPVTVTQGVSLASLSAAGGSVAYGVGNTGYRTQFTWFDRAGNHLETVGAAENTPNAAPALSSDGLRVAFSRLVSGNWDVWTLDMRGVPTPVTVDPGLDFNPVWSSDRHRIFYTAIAGGKTSILSQRLNDPSGPQFIGSGGAPTDVSPDGRYLLYNVGSNAGQSDIWALPLDGDRTPRQIVATPFGERDAQFSPDGRWVAYQSDDSGRAEIYVQPFSGPGERTRVSSGGGEQVRWARSNGELFYIAADRRLVVVTLKMNAERGSIEVGEPTSLFRTRFDQSTYQLVRQQYCVTADGQRFLMNIPSDIREPSSIVVMLNWTGRP